MTLYMNIGGRAAIAKALALLKERLEADPCFDAAPVLDEVHDSSDFSEFLIFLTGGAPFYDGKPVSDLLAPLCGCKEIYGRFVDHLVATLLAGQAGGSDETSLRALMDRLQPQVLSPRPAAPVLVDSVETDLRRA